MKTWKWVLLCASLIVATAVRAEEARPSPGTAYWYVSLGGFEGDETTGQLENEGDAGGIVAGLGVRPWSYLAFEAEVAGYSAEYDRPPFPVPSGVTFDPRMRVSSAGIFGNAKAVYERDRASVYAGMGLGVFSASAELSGTLFGFDAERIEDDTGIGFQFIAGGNVAISERSRVGVEYRRLELEADFGELSGGEADVGGDYVAITFRQALR